MKPNIPSLASVSEILCKRLPITTANSASPHHGRLGNGFITVSPGLQTDDGGFIIAGSKLSQATTNEDVWILKLTHDLSTEWDYTYGGSSDDIGTSVNQTTDGGYIITGNTYSYGNQSEIILLKIDGSGVVQDFSN